MTGKSLRIALLGNEADHYLDLFSGDDVRIIYDQRQISKDDDFVFALGYSRIIMPDYLMRPRVGVFVNHSTDLPIGRGWAPLQWSVLKGFKYVTITIFKATSEVDAGDYCLKDSFPIEPLDTIESLYFKDRIATRAMLLRLIDMHRKEGIRYIRQKGEPEYWKKRYPSDSKLDKGLSIGDLWDHLRVCDNERYPAYFDVDENRVFVRHKVEDGQDRVSSNNRPTEDDISMPLISMWRRLAKYADDCNTRSYFFRIGNSGVTLTFEICPIPG